jgi:DNA helicase-2/ATP-dependent DNA helicase PcrA
MAVDTDKVRLNPEQKLAVDTIEGPLLIIAGAGSGKTGVITNRIVNMLNHGIPQASIMALTFTNKAAKEMGERVKLITGKKLSNLTISTFHSFGLKVLKDKITYLGYRNNFTIYDTGDKLSCIKEAARELKLKYEAPELMELGNLFSSIKTQRITWNNTNDMHRPLYDEYLEHMKLYNAVDFDDLIVLPIQIFEENFDILNTYRKRYRYLMIDEFQDTSFIQYKFLNLMAHESRNICCVGDDDQSIYSWRGANYENILQFEKDYPELIEIKLERNYRSTGTILKAANAVISNNTNRKIKELWTELDHNEMTIKLNNPEDDRAEGEFIAETIAILRTKERIKYDQVGILIRTNNLSKAIEDALLAHNIPYTMSGGTSFFERKEIRDIISYLKVINNPDDDINVLRVLNVPRRGVGKKTLETLINLSVKQRCSLYSAISSVVYSMDSPVTDTIKAGLAEFVELIDSYTNQFAEEKNLAETTTGLVEEIDYWAFLLQEHQKNDKVAKWKYDNVMMFIDFFRRWEKNPDNLDASLSKWINRITLVTRDENQDSDGGKVNLMTIHASKGLEFDNVFLAGVEEDIMPHARAVAESENNVEEERRLFYVAITRARKKLFITSCQKRKQMREIIEPKPSRFLTEIPEDLLEQMESEVEIEDEKEASQYFSRMPWNT